MFYILEVLILGVQLFVLLLVLHEIHFPLGMPHFPTDVSKHPLASCTAVESLNCFDHCPKPRANWGFTASGGTSWQNRWKIDPKSANSMNPSVVQRGDQNVCIDRYDMIEINLKGANIPRVEGMKNYNKI